jgi:NADPH:quinone reductase-like Zn-dependent oxidoreductase
MPFHGDPVMITKMPSMASNAPRTPVTSEKIRILRRAELPRKPVGKAKQTMGKSSFSGSIRSLKQNGRLLLANPRLSQMIRGFCTSTTSRRKVILGAANQTTDNLIYLKELIETGKLISVIDRNFPLEQTAEVHKYVEAGYKKGNVVVTMVDN